MTTLYRIVTGTYINIFESECNKLLAVGWKLQGGVSMQYNLGTYLFAQSFIKHPDESIWQRDNPNSDERNFAARDAACTDDDEPGGW
jgi:hypothetical protein